MLLVERNSGKLTSRNGWRSWLRKSRPLQPVMTYQLASVFIAFLTSSSCSRSCNHATNWTRSASVSFWSSKVKLRKWCLYVQLVLQNIVVHKSRQWHLDFPRYSLYCAPYFFSFIPIVMFGYFWSIFPLCLVCLHFCTLCVMRKPNSWRML